MPLDFTIFGINFSGLGMLGRYLDGFMTGFGFACGLAIVFLMLSLYVSRCNKKDRCDACGKHKKCCKHETLVEVGGKHKCIACLDADS